MEIKFDPGNSNEVSAIRAMLNALHGPEKAAPVAEEKKPRKRRTKEQIAADKAAEEAAKAHPDEEPTGKSAEASSDPFSNGYDFAAAKADLEKVRDHPDHGLEVVVSILKAAGIAKVNDLDGNDAALTVVKSETAKRLG